VGELSGGVTGALHEPPRSGARPALELVLALPLPPVDDNPFSHGMSEAPSLGYAELDGEL
jgi:hypothetical protein